MANGLRVDGQFLLSTTTAGDQNYSSIAMDDNGHVVAVWSGNGIGDDSGVFAQRYQIGTDHNNRQPTDALSPSPTDMGLADSSEPVQPAHSIQGGERRLERVPTFLSAIAAHLEHDTVNVTPGPYATRILVPAEAAIVLPAAADSATFEGATEATAYSSFALWSRACDACFADPDDRGFRDGLHSDGDAGI